MNKKFIISLGGMIAFGAPLVTIISCGSSNNKTKKQKLLLILLNKKK